MAFYFKFKALRTGLLRFKFSLVHCLVLIFFFSVIFALVSAGQFHLESLGNAAIGTLPHRNPPFIKDLDRIEKKLIELGFSKLSTDEVASITTLATEINGWTTKDNTVFSLRVNRNVRLITVITSVKTLEVVSICTTYFAVEFRSVGRKIFFADLDVRPLRQEYCDKIDTIMMQISSEWNALD